MTDIFPNKSVIVKDDSIKSSNIFQFYCIKGLNILKEKTFKIMLDFFVFSLDKTENEVEKKKFINFLNEPKNHISLNMILKTIVEDGLNINKFFDKKQSAEYKLFKWLMEYNFFTKEKLTKDINFQSLSYKIIELQNYLINQEIPFLLLKDFLLNRNNEFSQKVKLLFYNDENKKIETINKLNAKFNEICQTEKKLKNIIKFVESGNVKNNKMLDDCNKALDKLKTLKMNQKFDINILYIDLDNFKNEVSNYIRDLSILLNNY